MKRGRIRPAPSPFTEIKYARIHREATRPFPSLTPSAEPVPASEKTWCRTPCKQGPVFLSRSLDQLFCALKHFHGPSAFPSHPPPCITYSPSLPISRRSIAYGEYPKVPVSTQAHARPPSAARSPSLCCTLALPLLHAHPPSAAHSPRPVEAPSTLTLLAPTLTLTPNFTPIGPLATLTSNLHRRIPPTHDPGHQRIQDACRTRSPPS